MKHDEIEIEDREVHCIAYDCDLRRPGCVLIQAAMGGNSSLTDQLFPAETWLTSPTPGMRLMRGDRALWEKVAILTQHATVKDRL